jgi:uncharacterized delta-60 repeat protein
MRKIYNFLFVWFCSLNILHSQLPASNDSTFNTYDDGTFGDNSGFDNKVNCSIVQSDGKIIVGGIFGNYNGAPVAKIARLNPNGSLDNSFVIGTGFYNALYIVNCLALQPDGKIIVGGYFSQYNGTSLHGLVRLNTDGTIDPSFNTTIGIAGATATVNDLVIQSDGKIIAAGDFTTYNGTTRNRIVRINTDGSLDATFNPGTGCSVYISSLVLQPDGKVIAGGNFTTYNGTSRNRIVRIQTNGTIDMLFNPGTGFSGAVECLALQPDGKLVVGGAFSTYNGTSRNRIARINADGSIDLTLNPGAGFNNTVYCLALQSDTSIIAGGDFTTYDGVSGNNRIIRLNSMGGFDPTFNTGTGAPAKVNCLIIQSDEKVLVGGEFTSFNGVGENGYFVRLDTFGAYDPTFNAGTGFNWGNVITVAVQADGKILVGGTFSRFNGMMGVNRLVRLFPDGSIDTSFHVGTGFSGGPYQIALQSDGKLIVLGGFSSYNGTPCMRIVRINTDGSIDNTFSAGTGFATTPSSIVFQSDGKMIIGGSFTSFDGNACNRICRLNADGSFDPTYSIGTGFDANINKLVIQPDGKVIAGGNFFGFNGVNRDMIARLNTNGTLDMTFSPGSGFNAGVSCLVLQSDGKVIASGGFTSYNGNSCNRIARLNTDGSFDAGYNIGTGFNTGPTNLIFEPNGKVIAAGTFATYNAISRIKIARLNSDGTLDMYFNPGTGFNNTLSAIALQSDGKIVVGGYFSLFNGTCRNKIARLHGGECNNSSSMTVVACSSYTLNSQTYTSSGTYYQTIPNALGCDSTITLNLTIHPTNTSHLYASACSTYTLNSQTYSVTGNYNQNFTNVFGCDSTVVLHLYINNNSSVLNSSVCDSTTINGQTYTASGSYSQTLVNHSGCDSVLYINLIVHYTTPPINLFEDVCDSYTLNSQTYTTTGLYNQNFTNIGGCDSILHLNLIVRYSSAYTINANACNSYTLNALTYTNSGIYTQTLTNHFGCDSTINLNLVVDGNAIISQTGNTFTSSIADTYQWINCSAGNSVIAGANNQTYTPNTSGSYAVITTENTCIDTSECSSFISIGLENNDLSTISVYPNPTTGNITIDMGYDANVVTIELLDVLGRKLSSSVINQIELFNLEIPEKPGIYFISISSFEDNVIQRVIKN